MGAAEFSRDKDFAILHSEENLEKLRTALRTPAHLTEIAARAPSLLDQEAESRPLLRILTSASFEELEKALLEEQERERARDREYWKPLREELEAMRRSRGLSSS